MEAVTLRVEVPGGDAEERQIALDELAEALGEHPDITVEPLTAPTPSGAKGGDLVEALVTSSVSSVLPVTATLVAAWLERRRKRCTVIVDLGDGVSAQVTDLDTLEDVKAKLTALRDHNGG